MEEKHKYCGRCRRWLPYSAFYKRSKATLQHIHSICKECQKNYNEKNAEHFRKVRKERFAEMLSEANHLKEMEKKHPHYFRYLGVILPTAYTMSRRVGLFKMYKDYIERLVEISALIEKEINETVMYNCNRLEVHLHIETRKKLIEEFVQFIKDNKHIK